MYQALHERLPLQVVELFHLHQDAEGDLRGVLGLAVVVEELSVGVDEVDDDGVVDDVVHLLVPRAGREIDPATVDV